MTDLHVGHVVGGDPTAGSGRVLLGADDLTTHGVIVGMTGSGKTGLGVIALEEALSAGIPALVIDPKGDMANLCLAFPDLAAADFLPYVDAAAATRSGTTVEAVAAATAERWAAGLAGSGVGREQLERFAGVPVTVYTPGSDVGVGLDLVGSLAPPPGADVAAQQDEVTDVVSGLLALVGVTSDPLTGREHILLSNLLLHAWGQGQALDLPTLIAHVQQPPLRRLGVMEVDAFFPAADRTALAMRLNGLLASPTFASWAKGVPLDIQRLLHTDDGGPRCAVVSIAHLDDAERQFVVTLVLSRLITWMRQQAGTSSLRALVYMDEVFGFVPPVAAPPSKHPILVIMKQARAFGVGMVLSTQNPVDLDYKAISNAGTWMIGRLQTERDRDRLLEGMRAAAGDVDVTALGERISALDRRQFVLHTTGGDAPSTFATRWAMSYLAGPMTGPQIATLMAAQKAALAPPPPAAPRPATAPAAQTPALPPPVAGGLADDETPLAPEVAPDVPQRVLDPAASWAASVGAVPGGTRLRSWVALRIALTFDEARAGLDHDEEFEAVLPVNADPGDLTGLRAVDHDDRDLLPDVPAGAAYVLPAGKVATRGWWTALQKAVRDELHATRSMTVLHNAELKLWSRPTEDRTAFEARCRVVADEREDAEAEVLRRRLEAKVDRIRDALERAQDRVAQVEADVSARRGAELVNIGSSVLGGFLGGRRSARGVAADLRRAAGNRGQTARAQQRLETAQGLVVDAVDELAALEDELATELLDIDHRWMAAAGRVEEVAVGLEKSDVTVQDAILVWVPTSR